MNIRELGLPTLLSAESACYSPRDHRQARNRMKCILFLGYTEPLSGRSQP